MKNKSKYKNIIIIGSLYSLLFSLLVFKIKESYIFLANGIKCNTSDSILKDRSYITNIHLKKRNFLGVLEYYYNFFKYFIKIVKYYHSKFYANSYLRESGILFKYTLLEDGLADYKTADFLNPNKKKSLKSKIKKILQLDFRRDEINRIEEFYLTGLAPIPLEIKNKVKIFNLKKLWNKKNDIEKQEILTVFGFNEDSIKNIRNRKYILYTQPLSEDNIVLEEEKIELYSKILENYDRSCIILKKHPREKTDYKKIFPDIEVIDQVFPAELLVLLDIHFEKAITIFSTAALTDDKVKVDFYGTEIHSKLFKEFGSQDTIMKRNAFLDKLDEKESK